MIKKEIHPDTTLPSKIVLYKFNSVFDFYDFLNENFTKPHWNLFELHVNARKHWIGENYEECMQALKCGYKNNVKELSKTIKLTEKYFSEGQANKSRLENYYCGSRPNVANYIQGLPLNMMRLKKTPQPKKIVNIIFDCDVSCNQKKKQVCERFNNILAYIYKVCLKGYKVRLSLLSAFNVNRAKEAPFILIKLKDETEPFNLTKLSYPCTSVSFLRAFCIIAFYQIYWHLAENKQSEDSYVQNAGMPLYSVNSNKRSSLLSAISEPNTTTLYVNLYSDLERTFNNL